MGKPGVPRPRPKASEPPREAEVDGLDEGEEISRTEPARNVDLQPGHVIDGKYELEQPLAKGGMGAIWVARHLKLNEPVAIKFMSAELAASKEALVRFEREATAVAQLQRKTTHVVHIHDYGIDGNNPYIVMELLEGETLHTRLKRCGRLMLHEVAAIVEQLCRALRPAHQAGIVHRDIKPSNVFINRKGDEEVLKVIDFGLAKGDALDVTGESTKSGGVLGSPHYMSPEQATGNAPVDHRSDVWAVGVVAYRCVVGKLPFPGTKLGDILVRVARDPAPSPSTLVQGVPEELDAFFDKALAKEAEDRFQSVDELSSAFGAAIGLAPTVSGGFRPMSHSMANIVISEPPVSAPSLGAFDGAPRADAAGPTTDTAADIPTTPYGKGRAVSPEAGPTSGGSLGGTSLPSIARSGRLRLVAATASVVLILVMVLALAAGEDLEAQAASFSRTAELMASGARALAAER
ncbi:MAG: serine/threonine-protein kinase, partial [Polyangiaceae bacterium]